MAPIGGGPPVGSAGGTFTGPAQALEIIGNHGYAVSGAMASTTVGPVSMLKFTSGNYYLVGELTLTGGVEFTAAGVPLGLQNAFQLTFNGAILANYKTDTNEEDSPTLYVVPIIIPPYTEVEVQGIANLNNAEDLTSASIHGRICRG